MQPQNQQFGQFGAPGPSYPTNQFGGPGANQFGGSPAQFAGGSGTQSPFGGTSTPGSGSQAHFGGGIMLPSTPRPGSAAAAVPHPAPPPQQQQQGTQPGAKDPFADLAGLF